MPTPVPRPELVESLTARASSGPPLLLCGPPGCGKSTLLAQAATRLRASGQLALQLDLLLAASSPEGLVEAALAALPRACVDEGQPLAVALARLAESGRQDSAAAVDALLRLLRDLQTAAGRPVVVLIDEPTEIRSLATFPRLRDVVESFGTALAERRGAALLATSFPTRAGRFWRGDTRAVPPLGQDEVEPLAGSAAAALIRASGGLPCYLAPLLERALSGEDPARAWIAEMSPGGALDVSCRRHYETLLLRSRGYGMSKAALAAVAREEGLNLTSLAARLGRSPGAVRDYLGWLVDVDAIRSERKRYYFVDPLLRRWVSLNAGGGPAEASELEDAAAELFPGAVRSSAPRPRHDSLMEID